MSSGIDVITERAKIRAPYPEQARVSQNIKRMLFDSPCTRNLSDSQRESLEHIANKIARIVTGDPNEVDAWTDISGYAELIVNELTGRKL